MKTNSLKIIGKGIFSTCYELDEKRVLIKSCDPIKECISLGWFPKSRFFPKVEQRDSEEYIMEKFERITAPKKQLNEKDYALYIELKSLSVDYIKNNYDFTREWVKQFKTLRNKMVSRILIEAIEACGNYGSDIKFEISPRNIMVKKGKLILLDCFFSLSALNEVRTSKRH